MTKLSNRLMLAVLLLLSLSPLGCSHCPTADQMKQEGPGSQG